MSLISLTPYIPVISLILRLGTGIALMIHGYPKFKKDVKQRSVQWMQSMNIPASTVSLVALNEFLGGLFLLIGLIVPVVAVLIAIQFIAIIIMKKTKMKAVFFGSDKPTYEVDLLYLLLALTLLVIGPGQASLDYLLGIAG